MPLILNLDRFQAVFNGVKSFFCILLLSDVGICANIQYAVSLYTKHTVSIEGWRLN